MNEEQIEAVAELKAKWLEDHNAKDGDVMIENETGLEYILNVNEDGSEVIWLPVFTEMDADMWLDENPKDHHPAFGNKAEEEAEKDLIAMHEQENKEKGI